MAGPVVLCAAGVINAAGPWSTIINRAGWCATLRRGCNG
jgi:hypothetical protein